MEIIAENYNDFIIKLNGVCTTFYNEFSLNSFYDKNSVLNVSIAIKNPVFVPNPSSIPSTFKGIYSQNETYTSFKNKLLKFYQKWGQCDWYVKTRPPTMYNNSILDSIDNNKTLLKKNISIIILKNPDELQDSLFTQNQLCGTNFMAFVENNTMYYFDNIKNKLVEISLIKDMLLHKIQKYSSKIDSL